MRYGITILPEYPWAQAGRRWRAAQELGFNHAWTYDHLVWAGLPDSPWFGTTPTLTAAATVTSTIRLGTFVASPNYRHPVAFHRDIQALDDISGGRLLLGLGTGGDLDSQLIGQPTLTTKERVDRFQEFVRLLRRLQLEDHVDSAGPYFPAHDARTLPPVADVPLLVAANGPRSLRFAAREGDGWITTGSRAETVDEWFAGVAASAEVLGDALAAAGRDAGAYPRYLSLDQSPLYSLSSVDAFEELAGRAAALGFTDVISHWPRDTTPYLGDQSILEQVADRVLRR